MSTQIRITIVFAALTVFSACKPKTDLNNKCSLVKRNLDGGQPLPIAEADLKSKKANNKDFLSFGTVECEDLLCVRDADFQSDAGPTEAAFGYCSKACQVGAVCPSFDETLDKGSSALSCRALLLDAETLARLKETGGLPGNITDPYFCARSIADAGK
jgi:hypothetical protein